MIDKNDRMPPLDQWIERTCGIGMEDRRELEAWQLEQFEAVLAFGADHAPYYRETLKMRTRLQNMEEIGRLPFTDGECLIHHGNRMLCVPQGEISRVVSLSTSGTVNRPKKVFFTEEDQELTIDFFRHGMSVLSDPGEKALVALPCHRAGSVGDLLARGLKRLGVKPLPYGIVEDLAEAAGVLEEERPEVCIGIPVQMLALACYCSRHRIKTGVKRVLLSTDHVPDSLAERLEALWDCRVFRHYGTTEMGLGGAVECGAHQGMHIREQDLYVEVVDPETGEVLAMETPGELVFTTLTRKGMPLIRYRTGDRGMITDKRCSCGSILKRILYAGERLDSSRWDGIGIQELDEQLFAVPGVVDYRLECERDQAPMLVIWRLGSSEMEVMERIRRRLFALGIRPGRVRIEQIEDRILPYRGKRRLALTGGSLACLCGRVDGPVWDCRRSEKY